MTPSVKKQEYYLKTRSGVIQAIRDYFTDNNYLEIDTPIRCPAIIPEAQIDPVASENHFLQASPELYMKRLLSKGFDKIFQICKCFRKNERSPLHLPEFTLLEWYSKDHTYIDLMDQCYELINFIAKRLNIEDSLIYQNKTIQIKSPWSRLTVKQAFEQYSNISLESALKTDKFDEIISFQIEPCLGQQEIPVFLYNYPASQASLAKLLPKNLNYAQRFELYIAGIELANCFTELTDPIEQRIRFDKENQIRRSLNKPPIPIPEIFLEDLKTMPDSAGIALGIDRLVMIFCNVKKINDIIAFPPEIL